MNENLIFTTGLAGLDFLMKQHQMTGDGGIERGELMLVFGHDGSGKTSFCRNMILANKLEGAMGIHSMEPGNLDVLRLGGKPNRAEFVANFDMDFINTPKDNYSNRLYELIKNWRQEAYETNTAVIFTFNVKAPMNANATFPFPDEFSAIRVADYVLSLRKGSVYLKKNRNGRKGIVKTKIENYHNLFPIMKDAV